MHIAYWRTSTISHTPGKVAAAEKASPKAVLGNCSMVSGILNLVNLSFPIFPCRSIGGRNHRIHSTKWLDSQPTYAKGNPMTLWGNSSPTLFCQQAQPFCAIQSVGQPLRFYLRRHAGTESSCEACCGAQKTGFVGLVACLPKN